MAVCLCVPDVERDKPRNNPAGEATMRCPTRLFLLVLVCASSGFGTIYKSIGGPTPDYPDFVQAANSLPSSLSDHYVFTAYTGVYNQGQVNVNSITTGIFSITFRAGPGQNVTVGAGAGSQTFYILQTSNVYLERLVIQGGTSNGVHYRLSTNGAVRACSIVTAGSGGVEFNQSDGCRLDSSSILVNNNGMSSAGVKLFSSDNCVVKGCRVRGVPSNGIWITDDALNADVDSCRIAYDGASYAVRVAASSHNARIRRSLISCWGDHGILVQTSDYAEITGTRIDQSSYGQGWGIRLEAQSRYAQIRGCIVNTNRSDGILAQNASTNLLLDSCQVNQQATGATRAIRLWGSNSCRVRRCSVTTAGNTGIHVQSSSYIKIDSTSVTGSSASGNDILADDGTGCRFLGCALRGTAQAGIRLETGTNWDSVIGNRFLNTGNYGVCLYPQSGQSSNHVVANNFVSGYSAAGIYLYNQYAPRVYYNTVVGPTSALVGTQCILVNTAFACSLKNNVVWNRHNGASFCYDLVYAWEYALGSDYNDLFYGYKVARVNGVEFPDLAYWQSQALRDSHSISADPRLVDVGTGNLHLLATSPCIEAGVAIPSVSRDIDFDARHNPPDIGADEYAMPMPQAFQLVAPKQDSGNTPIDIQLVWRPSANARRYDIFFGLSPAIPESVATVLAPETTFSRVGLLHDTLYRWYVRARNRTGSVISTPSSSRFRTIVDLPTAFNLRQPHQDSAPTPVTIKLQWQRSTRGTVAYDVFWGDPPMTMVRFGLSDTFFDTTGLLNNRTYRWTIRARNIAGATWARDTFRFTTIALPAPFLLRYPRNDSQNAPIAPRLEWYPSANGVISYDVYWGNPPNQLVRAGLSTTLYDTSGLTNDTTYYWTVKASNIGGSTWSTDTFHFRTIVAPPRQFHLLHPRNDSLNAPTSIHLDWEPSQNGSITYDVYWGDPPSVRVRSGLTGTSFDTSGLAPGQVCRWTVRANNIAGATWSRDTFRFTTTTLPSTFHLRYPRNDSSNAPVAVRLEWEPAVNGVISYDVYWGNPPNLPVKSGLSAALYDTSGLVNDTTYYWTVRARNSSGGTWAADTFRFGTVMGRPRAFHLLLPRNDSSNTPPNMRLEWEPSGGGSITYDVFWGLPPGTLVRSGLAATFYDTAGLGRNQTCYWTVRANNVMGTTWARDTFHFTTYAGGAPPGIWTRLPDMLEGARRKTVKDGGCLAYAREQDSGFVYALKGNNTCEFYRYNIAANAWSARESIPAYNRASKKKGVKKGGALVAGTNGRVYATKGNGTYDFWQYSPGGGGQGSGVWTQKVDVPTGTKTCKDGLSMVAVRENGANYIYLLKGSGTYEFHRYNADGDFWETTLPPAPGGRSGKPFKGGSCLADDNRDSIYCLKGSFNEFFVYSISARNWATRETLPKIYFSGKKKVKDGAGIAWWPDVVYGLKGGNTNEFWVFRCDENRWFTAPQMPAVVKRVKGGGALVAAPEEEMLFALRGNNTREFWRYGPLSADGYPLSAYREPKNVQSSSSLITHRFSLSVSPNPFTTSLNPSISYSLPVAGDVRLKLYDVTGKLVSTLASGYHAAGAYSLQLTAHSELARGIYVLKFEGSNYATTEKLILE